MVSIPFSEKYFNVIPQPDAAYEYFTNITFSYI